jgi:hypothetical protein
LDDQIKQIEECRTSGSLAETRNAYRILVGKPEGMKNLARSRRRIKIDCIAI